MTALLAVEDLRKDYPIAGRRSRPTLIDRVLRPNLQPAEPTTFSAVDGVSFTIDEGESVGLVGESGCGKSTLVGMLARLGDPTAGRILFGGEDIGRIPADRFHARPERAQIQIVFQDPHESLNPRFTAFDSIAEPLRRLEGLRDRAKLAARVTEIAAMVEFPADLLGRFPHQLSGGQKARVNIARGIVLSPRLLILDEPTTALDVSVQAVILNLLARLKDQLRMTYLFVSHDLNVVRLMCDRVMVMTQGRFVETGDAEDVFRNPTHDYTRMLIAAIPGARAAESA